jgi:hypothetical protein
MHIHHCSSPFVGLAWLIAFIDGGLDLGVLELDEIIR